MLVLLLRRRQSLAGSPPDRVRYPPPPPVGPKPAQRPVAPEGSLRFKMLFSVFLVLTTIALALTEFFSKRWKLGQALRHMGTGAGVLPRKGVQDIPGPLSLPWLGTGWITTMIGPYCLSQLHEAYHDMARRYGPIMKQEVLGNIPIINLFSRDAIEEVARYPSRYPIRPPTEISMVYRVSRPDRYTNLGIVNEQGENWSFLRKKLTKELTRPLTISQFLPDLDRVAEDFATLLRSRRDNRNRVPTMELIVKHLGLESMSTLVLGRRIGALDLEVQELGVRLARVVDLHFCACRDSYFGLLPLWKYIPTKIYTQYKEAEEEFYDIISKVVDDALRDEQETCECEPVQKVFMSILHAHDLDDRDKKSAIIDFIASGIMTLGNTLLFLLYHVAKNPKVQTRLYEELTSLSPRGKPLTAQDLRSAPYLHAVVKETYRFQPTAIHIARILEEEMDLNGYHLPAGSVVLLHNWIACLDEKNFSYANEFRPERWIPEESQGWRCSPKLVAPFGYGTRKCPGEAFTDQMLHLLLARMVREFRMDYEGELKTKFEFLLVPEGPINLILNDHE